MSTSRWMVVVSFVVLSGVLGCAGHTPSGMVALGQPAGQVESDSMSIQPAEVAIVHDPVRDIVCLSAALGLADIAARGTFTLPTGSRVSILLDPTDAEISGGGLPGRAIRMESMQPRAGAKQADGAWSVRVLTRTSSFRYVFIAHQRPADPAIWSDVFSVQLSDPPAPVPAWAMGATWYQIFPERFRNGNALNDPHGPGVFLAKWTDDWYKVQPGELEAWMRRRNMPSGEPIPDRTGGPLYHVIWDRRYGGDLQGVLEKLDELKDLGITAIYLNPIFEAMSLHKYDASDFRHIDDWLGRPRTAGKAREADGNYTPPEGETGDPKTWTWTPADEFFVKTFLPACKQRGMRVILDGVWNHTGRQFWAFQDIVRNGKKSPYADWYITEFDESGKLAGWSGWEGKNGHLPEFAQVQGGAGANAQKAVEKGDLNAGVKEHVFAVTKRWMDPDGDGDPRDGIDGWRLDVAGEIGEAFWKDWRALVKGINPDAIIVAEIWSKASEMFKGRAFDTQMNYPFAYPVLEWLTDKTPRKKLDVRPPPDAPEGTPTKTIVQSLPVPSSLLGERLAAAFNDAPATNLVHQNLFASHDTDRFVNMLWNPGRNYDQACAVQNGDDKARDGGDGMFVAYKAGRPPEEVYKLSLVGLAIQATYCGSPMVYYGDELGMWGADDPTCRKPTPWADKGKNANKDDAIVLGHREQYKAWLNLRRHKDAGDALKYGSTRYLETGNPEVFAFQRSLGGVRVIVVANRGASAFESRTLAGGESGVMLKVPGVSARAWWFEASTAMHELK